MQFKCVEGCSDCCIYREYYPEKRYGKVGVLLMPPEKERVEQLARNLGLKITILPRIGVGSMYSDGRKVGPKRIIAYQLMGVNDDGNLCPFLDVNGKERSPHGGYKCKIYEERPLACRAYPVIDTSNVKLDAKCQFCKSCSGKVESVQQELEALAKIQQLMHFDENDIWRYATGVGNKDDMDIVQKGWILEDY
ncbi:MAG: YkgJ family cysteine cluster protein [Nitrososphaerales archaeon]